MSEPAKILPLVSTPESDRWSWLPARDRSAIKVATYLERQANEDGLLSVTREVLSQVKGRPLGIHDITPYWETWRAWSVHSGILCAALAVVQRKSQVSDPVALCHHLVEQYAVRAGLVKTGDCQGEEI